MLGCWCVVVGFVDCLLACLMCFLFPALLSPAQCLSCMASNSTTTTPLLPLFGDGSPFFLRNALSRANSPRNAAEE